MPSKLLIAAAEAAHHTAHTAPLSRIAKAA